MKRARRHMVVMSAAGACLLGTVGAIAEQGERPLDFDPLLAVAIVWGMSEEEVAENDIGNDASKTFERVSSANSSARLQHLRHWRGAASGSRLID